MHSLCVALCFYGLSSELTDLEKHLVSIRQEASRQARMTHTIICGWCLLCSVQHQGLGFHTGNMGCHFQDLCRTRRGWGKGNHKCHKAFRPRSSFLCLESALGCCIPLFSRVVAKLVLTISAYFSICLWGKWEHAVTYSAILLMSL